MAVLGNVMQSTKTNKKVLPSGYCITANTYTGTQTSEQHTVFNRTETIKVPTFSFQARDFVAELQFPSVRRQRQRPGWPQAWLTRPLERKTAEGEKNETLECLLKTNFFLLSCELYNRDEITDIKQIFLLLTLSLLEPLPEERTLKRNKEGCSLPYSTKTVSTKGTASLDKIHNSALYILGLLDYPGVIFQNLQGQRYNAKQ